MPQERRSKRSETLFTLDEPSMAILKYLSSGPEISFSGRKLAEHARHAEKTLRDAMKNLDKKFIEKYVLRLKEEHRNEIFIRYYAVMMKSNSEEKLVIFEEFIRNIPNISEIYRMAATNADYLLKVNAKFSDDHVKIRDRISTHPSVEIVRSMPVERPINTPNSEISFLFD